MNILNQTEIKKLEDRDFYKYCQFIGKNARAWKNRFVALLLEVARRGIHKKHGFATIVKFAAVVGGIGKSTVEKVFQLDKHISDKPALKEILPKVGVSKMSTIAKMATKENQEELAEKVQKMPQSLLEMIARDHRKKIEEVEINKNREQLGFDTDTENMLSKIPRAGDLPDHEISENQGDRMMMKFTVNKNIRLELDKFRLAVEKEKKEALSWEEVMKELLVRATEPKKQYKKKTSKSKSRSTPESKKREEIDKYNGKCAVQDCDKVATEFHHPERYALNQSHENVIPVCKTHHQAAHYGLIKNEELSPEYWELRQNPDKLHPKYRIDQKVQKYRTAWML